MSKFMDRDFKGVWIPREIYLADDLSWSEKILLVEIHSLDSDAKKGCYASARHLAEFLGVTAGRVKNMIVDLKTKGYLKELWSDGHSRGLRVTLFIQNRNKKVTVNRNEKVTQPSQKRDAEPSRKSDHSNTVLVIQEKEGRKPRSEADENFTLLTASVLKTIFDLETKELLADFVPAALRDAWIEFVRKRKLTVREKKPTAEFWKGRVGYWLTDFQKDYKQDYERLKKDQRLPTASEKLKADEEARANLVKHDPANFMQGVRVKGPDNSTPVNGTGR
jgi:DNA-binding MarR family transcriptional regulator